MIPADFAIVYDLREPDAWDEARRHVRAWGRLYVDAHHLAYHHLVLEFRPAPDARWRDWERARAGWILGESEAA